LAVFVDGTQELELRPPFTGRVAARQGAHLLEVRDARGELIDQVKFVVRR
jgi:hypothetical protein